MHHLTTLLMAATVLCACVEPPKWDVPPLQVVVSDQAVDEKCTLRIACYQAGTAYIRPDPHLPEGRYVLEIPED